MCNSSIQEMREMGEGEEKCEIYLSSLKKSIHRILDMLNDDQLKSWRLIETVIAKEVKENNLSEDHVRNLLLKGELR